MRTPRLPQAAAWPVLLVAGVLEAVWATALSYSDGFTRPTPTAVFFVAATLSLVGLGWAMQTVPTGTAYAVWTGIGAVLTAAWAAVTGAEPLSPLRALFLAGVIGCVVGLQALDRPAAVATHGPVDPPDGQATRPHAG